MCSLAWPLLLRSQNVKKRLGVAPNFWILVYILRQVYLLVTASSGVPAMQALGGLKEAFHGMMERLFHGIMSLLPVRRFTPKPPFAAVVLSRAVNNLIIQVTGRKQGKTNYSFIINLK